jgi:hypothetical protein
LDPSTKLNCIVKSKVVNDLKAQDKQLKKKRDYQLEKAKQHNYSDFIDHNSIFDPFDPKKYRR